MTRSNFFRNAAWVGKATRDRNTFTVLRGRFTAESARKVTLNVLGLGFFKCYINGACINPDTFLPLSSDFEAGADPTGEVLTAHRIYVPRFDITPYVREGENVIAIHFGGGWYTHGCRPFGLPKAIYCVTVESETATNHFVSDGDCRVGDSFVAGYAFTQSEQHDYTAFTDCFGADFDDSGWDRAVLTEDLDTNYCTTDCPADALIETLPVTCLGTGDNGGLVYDCGQNTTGYPVLQLTAPAGETVTVLFSEKALPDGRLDMTHHHGQRFTVVSDGAGRIVEPDFTWYGFRCFEVIGGAEPVGVKVVYADIASASTFDCDNETLNWTYKTFLHTMLCNMHTGHPSDCPHLERRGYTGDGQLTCHAVLTALDAEAFYRKWMRDIGDCQDTLTGHIQYTAPYINSGGGPGGWGCAIVEVPYRLYKHYGDPTVLREFYPQMRRYIDYLEAHSAYGLVVSDKEGCWCLGDWCGPNILYSDKDITSHNQQVILPAPMVNTYFMVKSLEKMCEIARLIGKDGDITEYEEKIAYRKGAVQAAYYNAFDHNFIMNVQGANAYAVDLGLGDPHTYGNLVRYYRKLGHYDTGIFATDILTRLLFERGDAELAVDIMTIDGDQGYEHWRRNGATTFHEYWDSNRSRSHSHPMFGAPIAYFFEYLLGIKQTPDSAGYAKLAIEPLATSRFGRMAGSVKTPHGTVAVSYEKKDGRIAFAVEIPDGVEAVFKYGGGEYPAVSGLNRFEFEIV